MKHVIFMTLAVVGLVAGPSSARGQEAASAWVADSIETFTQELAEAWIRLDADDYLQWFSEDFVFYIEGHRVPRDGFEAVVRAATGALRQSTFEISEPHITVLAADAGVISFGLREVMVDTAGSTTDLRAAMTLVWQKREEQWRVVQAHESLRTDVGGANSNE